MLHRFYLRLVVLAAVALLLDLVLHISGPVLIGRYLGIPGVLLILASFSHSLRTRNDPAWCCIRLISIERSVQSVLA